MESNTQSINPESLNGKAESATRQATDMYRQVKETAKNVGAEVRDEIGKAASVARDATRTQIDDISKMGTENFNRLSSIIRERPVTAILLGIGAGYLLSTLVRTTRN